MAQATVKVEGLSQFLRALKRYAPEVRKEFNKRARSVASVIAADARGRAAWSRRIPGAIGPTVTTKWVGVRISRRKASHGPLYERGGKGNTGVVRHPLFGNRAFWFSTPARPMLRPAAQAHEQDTVEAMVRAIGDAKRGAGLR
jgi:hypothetical protein